MVRKEYRTKRISVLSKMERYRVDCKGCETHKAFNKAKDITGLTNACKQCPVGIELSKLGQQLLQLTKTKKQNKHRIAT